MAQGDRRTDSNGLLTKVVFGPVFKTVLGLIAVMATTSRRRELIPNIEHALRREPP